jgi:hypothetical protein
MRNRIVLAAALAVVALGMVSWAKSDVVSGIKTTATFAERWAPVDEALHSGSFVAKVADSR